MNDAYFDRIYSTDLRYVRDCYELCGDAHCCNFTRYKSKFMFMGRTQFQELPLLPGELDYLERHGLLKQFGDFEVRRTEFPIAQGIIRYEAIVSRRQGCACDNATRPTICRLYPLYPQYDATGALVGMETVGIYEELEKIGGMAPACQITTVPVTEMAAFISFANHIATNSAAAFHMEAFRLAKHAAAETVARAVAKSGSSPFRAFELSMLRSTLFDTAALRAQLEALATEYQALGHTDFLHPLVKSDDTPSDDTAMAPV